MITLHGTNLYLRALEPEDLEFVYAIENNENIWHVSNTNTPYSKFLIKQYLKNAHQDIFEAKQLRLVIVVQSTETAVGLIDLFDFDFNNRRAGVGIVINSLQNRHLGYGQEALQILINYSFNQLQLHQLYANIGSNNAESIHLFTKFDFRVIGVKTDWMFLNNRYHDEVLLQLLNPNH